MPYGTIIQQGRFTSDGNAKDLEIRSDVDWIEVINETQWATTQTPGRGVKFEWQRGLADGHAFEYTKADGADTLQAEKVTSGGFTLVDSSNTTPEAQQTGTTITKAAPAVCTVTGHGYSTGDVVRIYNSDNMDQLNGLEFSITRTAANTFELTNLDTNTANFTASTSFNVRRIPFQPKYAPRNRVITDISQAANAIVTFAVEHNFQVGDLLVFRGLDDFGMTELEGLRGEVTATGAADANGFTNTVTVDIDTSGFTAFAWPTAGTAPLTHPQATPFGDESSVLVGATDNVSFIGIRLGSGIDGPAGSTSDVIYWRAGKSENISNT
jgi:hypothetical protein